MQRHCSSVVNSSLCCLKFVQLKLLNSLEKRRILLFIGDKTETLISQRASYLVVLKGFIESILIKTLRTVMLQWHTIYVLVNNRNSYYRVVTRKLGVARRQPDPGRFSSRLQPPACGDQITLLLSSVQQDGYTV